MVGLPGAIAYQCNVFGLVLMVAFFGHVLLSTLPALPGLMGQNMSKLKTLLKFHITLLSLP